MIPWLAKNDLNLFYKYIDKSKIYFEWGSGGSTYQAAQRKNIKKIFSVESDSLWQTKLKSELIGDDRIKFIFNEMNTQPNNWGYPGKESTPEQWKSYSNRILDLTKEDQKEIDLIMIDGRFRVACCLKSFDVINDNCLIIFDDFLDRPKYHEVLNYYDIIEKTEDNRMVILKKKKNVLSVEKSVIEKYELNSF